uniref:Uncharacterized protein n=1 Tax=viral metagenome TaxID=1070528 RepID=A0A6M3KTS6_9ZZZZ
MKRFKIFTLALAVAFFLIAAPAQAVLQDMQASVYKWTGGMGSDGKAVLTKIDSGITFKVLAVDSDTAETTYYPGKTTALTNPVTTTSFASTSICNKKVAFRVDPTDATSDRYVDLIVVDTVGGYTAFVENFDQYTHTIVIDERPNVVHQGTIWFGASSTSEINTGINFAPNTLIQDVRVEVVTVASAVTLDVGLLSSGTGGDKDGFRKAVLLTTAGYVKDTAVITAGASVAYVPASTYGALLVTAITGDGATYSGGGGKSYLGHVVVGPIATQATTLTYQNPSTTGAGYIHYWFNRMR